MSEQFPSEFFVPAKALTGLPGISVVGARDEIVWTHLALDRHEVVTANDLLSESLLPGQMAVAGLPLLTKMHLWSLFGVSPGAKEPLNGPPARPCLGAGKVKLHFRRLKNQSCGKGAAWKESLLKDLTNAQTSHDGPVNARSAIRVA